jgi:hypothetical protein
VILKPKTPFTLVNCVQVVIDGQQPGGLQDSLGRVINGDGDGQPGGNVVAVICSTPMDMGTMPGMAFDGSSIIPAEVTSTIVPHDRAASLGHSTRISAAREKI